MEVSRSWSPLSSRLKAHPSRLRLVEHEVFARIRTAPLSIEGTAILLGQWWHPLHYFPTFLARSVAVLPDIESKCAVAKILYQETGEGDPRRAHEVVYVETMTRAGFSAEQVAEAAPFQETRELVEGYERASADRYQALGFLFATEFADLAMVSGIGTAVRRTTGVGDLDWVDIHVRQEPDHVEEADCTMLESFSSDEQGRIAVDAESMWRLWIGFFDRLETQLAGVDTRPPRDTAEVVEIAG